VIAFLICSANFSTANESADDFSTADESADDLSAPIFSCWVRVSGSDFASADSADVFSEISLHTRLSVGYRRRCCIKKRVTGNLIKLPNTICNRFR
jgi:hypothetical protein